MSEQELVSDFIENSLTIVVVSDNDKPITYKVVKNGPRMADAEGEPSVVAEAPAFDIPVGMSDSVLGMMVISYHNGDDLNKKGTKHLAKYLQLREAIQQVDQLAMEIEGHDQVGINVDSALKQMAPTASSIFGTNISYLMKKLAQEVVGILREQGHIPSPVEPLTAA